MPVPREPEKLKCQLLDTKIENRLQFTFFCRSCFLGPFLLHPRTFLSATRTLVLVRVDDCEQVDDEATGIFKSFSTKNYANIDDCEDKVTSGRQRRERARRLFRIEYAVLRDRVRTLLRTVSDKKNRSWRVCLHRISKNSSSILSMIEK